VLKPNYRFYGTLTAKFNTMEACMFLGLLQVFFYCVVLTSALVSNFF